MLPERWRKVNRLFQEALKLDSNRRATFLQKACSGDEELRIEVESLLAEHEQTEGFMEDAAFHIAAEDMAHEQTHESTDSLRTDGIEASLEGRLDSGLTLKGRYTIDREIGRGGIGVVYLARDKQLVSRPVVIKILNHRREESEDSYWYRRKFKQEIEALARIDHPGVVGILDAGQTPDGKPFFVMQYVEGFNLRSIMRPEGLEFERAAQIIQQMGQALSAAHEKGVYHRDLKPENIMLQRITEDEELVKLIDFGIARIRDSQLAGSDHTRQLAGTPLYMAPEQFEGRADASSDIYAMGLIAYEIVTGRRAFSPDSTAQLLSLQRAGVKVQPKDLRPAVPEAAQRIILKALSFEPEKRHAQAREFGRDLAAALTAPTPARDVESFGGEPKLGRLVAKMCNRRSQEDAFRHFFSLNSALHPNSPQIYLIPGEEGECHESLVERLLYRLEVFAIERHGEVKGAIKLKKIPWQYDDTLDSRQNRLLTWLFEMLSPARDIQLTDVSPSAFKRLLSQSLDAFVVIQHDIRVTRWDKTCRELLSSYFKYWGAVGGIPSGPRAIVFLSIIYPSSKRATFSRPWLSPGLLRMALLKRMVQRQLAELVSSSECPCLSLNELQPITRDDVMEWFSLYNIFDSEEIRLKRLENIFRAGSRPSAQKTMAEIELYLREIHRDFVLERGYL